MKINELIKLRKEQLKVQDEFLENIKETPPEQYSQVYWKELCIELCLAMNESHQTNLEILENLYGRES